MTFKLVIDRAAWQQHIDRYQAQRPWVVPVVKGDGYGIGAQRVLAQCERVRAPLIAVGTPAEAAQALKETSEADILVLFPVRADESADALTDPRIIRTVADAEQVRRVHDTWGFSRYVVEADSPMARHGVPLTELAGLREALTDERCVGVSVHNPPFGDQAASVRDVLTALGAAGIHPRTLFASHLSTAQVEALRVQAGATALAVRTGTDLWLGDSAALTAYGQVVDIHPVAKGRPVGYSQRTSRSDGWLAVIGGGTAHGVGIETARPRMTAKLAARRAARTALTAVGRAPSPFRIGGARVPYADVPHMQVSMVWLPSASAVSVGDWVPCDMRITVTRFDEVEVTDGATTAS